MKKEQRNNVKTLWMSAAALLIIIAAVASVSVAYSSKASSYAGTEPDPRVAEGVSYIEKMESVSAVSIEEKILSEEQARLDEERLAEMLSDPAKIFSAIQDMNIVLVGESRTSGFNAYGWLDENHFLGGIGWSILEVPSLYEQIAALQPSYLVFCFGINEMPRELGMAVYIPTPEVFMDTLSQSFDEIRKRVPDVKIYMNCIVPCSEEGYRQAPGFTAIPEWNEYIKNYCAEHGYGYIDISDLCEEHISMYREDGMHLISDFYPFWGARILETIMRDQ